jgi:integrase/recombinase XerD
MPNDATAVVIIEATDNKVAELTDLIAGQLAPSSQRVYKSDLQAFAGWMIENGLTLDTIRRPQVVAYRLWLQEHVAKRTAMRRLAVVRRLFQEAMYQHVITENPAENVRGFKVSGDEETPHTALSTAEARELLSHIHRDSLKGLRDYALILLLIRTGIRRAEASAANVDDLTQEQGHYVLTIRHGKGDKRRKVKVMPDAYRAIQEYRHELALHEVSFSRPLFLAHWKGGKVRGYKMSEKAIERTLLHYAQQMTTPRALTPHDMRATFATLALEGGAQLHQVQYAMGHADPRTTEHYQRRKLNLDDNAADYIRGL